MSDQIVSDDEFDERLRVVAGKAGCSVDRLVDFLIRPTIARTAAKAAEQYGEQPEIDEGQEEVACVVCWASVIHAHWKPHYRWHLREGHVDVTDSAESGPG